MDSTARPHSASSSMGRKHRRAPYSMVTTEFALDEGLSNDGLAFAIRLMGFLNLQYLSASVRQKRPSCEATLSKEQMVMLTQRGRSDWAKATVFDCVHQIGLIVACECDFPWASSKPGRTYKGARSDLGRSCDCPSLDLAWPKYAEMNGSEGLRAPTKGAQEEEEEEQQHTRGRPAAPGVAREHPDPPTGGRVCVDPEGFGEGEAHSSGAPQIPLGDEFMWSDHEVDQTQFSQHTASRDHKVLLTAIHKGLGLNHRRQSKFIRSTKAVEECE